MNEKETLETIIKNNEKLTDSVFNLSTTLANTIKRQQKLERYIKKAFQALDDKENRNFQQECQYLYLKKLIAEI